MSKLRNAALRRIRQSRHERRRLDKSGNIARFATKDGAFANPIKTLAEMIQSSIEKYDRRLEYAD